MTYNLYALPVIPIPNDSAKFTTTPLNSQLRRILSSESLLPMGGTVGFFCQHIYPQSNKGASGRSILQSLKGIDAAIFSTLQELGIAVHVRPVLEKNSEKEDVCEDYEMEEEDSDSRVSDDLDDHENDATTDGSNVARSTAPKSQLQRDIAKFENARASALRALQPRMQASQSNTDAFDLTYLDVHSCEVMMNMKFPNFHERLKFVVSQRSIKELPEFKIKGPDDADRIGFEFGEPDMINQQTETTEDKDEVRYEECLSVDGN